MGREDLDHRDRSIDIIRDRFRHYQRHLDTAVLIIPKKPITRIAEAEPEDHQVLGQELTLGELMLFYFYLHMFYGPLRWLGRVNSWMTRANSIVIPGGKLDLAMQLIFTPLIHKLMDLKRRAS